MINKIIRTVMLSYDNVGSKESKFVMENDLTVNARKAKGGLSA